MKNLEGRPAAVQRLVRETAKDNPRAIEQHRAMSSRGGKAAAESKRLQREQLQRDADLLAARHAEEAEEDTLARAELYTESDEGEILPPKKPH